MLSEVVRLNRQLDARAGIHPNPAMFNEVLERACQMAKHDFLVCLIGDGAGADDETVRLVTRLSEHNDVLSVFVHDPLEVELPDVSRLVLAEGQLQLEVNAADHRFRSGFRTDFQERLEWFQTVSRQREIPLLPISTAEDVGAQIRRQLGHFAE